MHPADDVEYSSWLIQGCPKGTRRDVLLQLEDWLEDDKGKPVFWLNGIAGSGKSAVAKIFAHICLASGKLGANFFCSREHEERSNPQLILPTLAFQLAVRYPWYREEMLKLMRTGPDLGQEPLCWQMENLIVGPFKATQIQTVIIIDALDQCKDHPPGSAILSTLSSYVDQIPNVKFFITGSPVDKIQSGFRLSSLFPVTEVLRLHKVERASVYEDICFLGLC